MCTPAYQDIAPDAIPLFEPGDGNRVKILAGRYAGVAGPVQAGATAPLYLDIHLVPQTQIAIPIETGHAAFAYVYEGVAVAGSKPLGKGELGVLGDGDRLTLRTGDDAARLLVVAGKPLREPIAKYGPFVMNTEAELHQAFADYRAGRF
jgi:redox-sensitive bicupin YhaK (pirin superfamily)